MTARNMLLILLLGCGVATAFIAPRYDLVANHAPASSPDTPRRSAPVFDHVPTEWEFVQATCRDADAPFYLCEKVAEAEWDAEIVARRKR